jgi:hypothetical protein
MTHGDVRRQFAGAVFAKAFRTISLTLAYVGVSRHTRRWRVAR